mgnify:CR=1 FL=1
MAEPRGQQAAQRWWLYAAALLLMLAQATSAASPFQEGLLLDGSMVQWPTLVLTSAESLSLRVGADIITVTYPGLVIAGARYDSLYSRTPIAFYAAGDRPSNVTLLVGGGECGAGPCQRGSCCQHAGLAVWQVK